MILARWWVKVPTTASNFFFASRRRHTRWTDDWSSDVCSSDLSPRGGVASGPPVVAPSEAPSAATGERPQIGRASCRERVWNDVASVAGEGTDERIDRPAGTANRHRTRAAVDVGRVVAEPAVLH